MPKLLLAAAAVAALALPASAQQQTTMRISHQVPTAHHLHKMLEGFAAEAEKNSNGEVKVQLFPAEQAHKAAENHPAVARGAIEGALSVNQQWGNTIPEMNVMVIPYIIPELEKIRKFPGSEAAKILGRKLEEKGVRNLAWFYITRQAIYTSSKKPLLQLADFQGIKIRGFNKIADSALEKLGAAPSAMPGPEVYNALQTGVLDAGLTDVSAAFSRRYYEVQKFGTVTPAFTVYFHLYVNPAWWSRLPAAHRTALEAAAGKAEQDAVGITEETASDAIRQLQEKGMQLKIHNAQEAEVWKTAMQPPVVEAVTKAAPQDGASLIELLRRL